jgi:hypothetical protein
MSNETKQLIADFRGGFPDECSFCDTKTDPRYLEPEEGGDWICHWCIDRWEHEDQRRWATGQPMKPGEDYTVNPPPR